MSKIKYGVTPAEFISALNTRFSGVSGRTILTTESTVDEINSNFTNLKNNYPTTIGAQVAVGINGEQYLNVINNNFYINAVDAGAYNDGSHVAETSAAINACLALQWEVYLPVGTFNISSLTMKGAADLTGAGISDTEIHGTLENVFIGAGVTDTLIDCVLSNFTVSGNHGYNLSVIQEDPPDNAIYFQAETSYIGVIVRNVKVKNLGGGGVQIKYADDALIENCEVENSNFVAYTIIGAKAMIKNCTSSFARMLVECRGVDANSRLDINNISGTELFNYGIRYYGQGSLYIDGVILAGNPSFDLSKLDDANQPHNGIWLCLGELYASGAGIATFEVKNYTLSHLNNGVHLQTFQTQVVDVLNFLDITYSDVLAGYWDIYKNEFEGVVNHLTLPN